MFRSRFIIHAPPHVVVFRKGGFLIFGDSTPFGWVGMGEIPLSARAASRLCVVVWPDRHQYISNGMGWRRVSDRVSVRISEQGA